MPTQNQTSPITTVLFDMDGTLVDNFTALHQSFAHAHTELGLPPPSYEKVLRTVGGSAPVTMARLMGEENAERALPIFNAHFEENMFEGVRTLPGTDWLLDSLIEGGIKVAMFTNKTGNIARTLCEHLGLTSRLYTIIGAGDTPWRKPEPKFTQYALDENQSKAQNTALVGDSPFDLQAAQACNLTAWLVATGTHEEASLKSCTPPANGVFPDLYALGEYVFGFKKP